MPTTTPKTNRLSVYMIKSEFQDLPSIVESQEPAVEIPDIGHFFFDKSRTHIPDWVGAFFGSTLANNIGIFASSAKGVLIVPIEEAGSTLFFALPFGMGRHLIKEGVIEERFGLKLVLNSADPGSFRSIDKTTLGSVPKHSREQMSRDVTPAEFGIDIEQDLISSITAKSKELRLGKTLTGKDAFSTSVKVDVTNLKPFLAHCLDRYRSHDYKQDFGWIDQIEEVRDFRVEKVLNDKLIDTLNARTAVKAWMAVPEVINWSDTKGFRYGRPKRGDVEQDLDLHAFLGTLNGTPVTLEILKGWSVYMISAVTEDAILHWSAYRMFVCRAGNQTPNSIS